MFNLAIALFWPLLQIAPPISPQNPPQVAQFVELSPRWDVAGTFETGLDRTAAVIVCPADASEAGDLIVADSSGQIVEMQFGPDGWKKIRTFGIGEPITAACAGAPHADRIWRVYVGTKSGRVLELSHGSLGWTTTEVRTVVAPVRNIQASDPGMSSVSQIFVIDGDGLVLNLWLSGADEWVTRLLPQIDGGATEVCFDFQRTGLVAIVAGPEGTIHKFAQDSTGSWAGGPWTSMPGGALDMAASADPTMKDIAVYYSGADGIFRYLFYDYKEDEKARIPIAGGVTQVIGKGPQRRFNEFFAMSAGEFCLFEFDFADREWKKIAMKQISAPVTSVAFGSGRGDSLSQIYVATLDGKVHEFVRQKMPSE